MKSGIQVPLNQESSTCYPKSIEWSPESKTILDSPYMGQKFIHELDVKFLKHKSAATLT